MALRLLIGGRHEMQQRVAAGVIGAVIGLAVGYINYKTRSNALGDLLSWIGYYQPRDAASWAIAGAIVGVAATFLRR
jgi:hypothetical protein